MKNLRFLGLLALSLIATLGCAQIVVPGLSSVSTPETGKLYYSQDTKTLSVFTGKFETVFIGQSDVVVIPPSSVDGQEIEIGTWQTVPGSVLLVKTISGKNWLLQTNGNRDYYVIRGKNMPSQHSDVKLSKSIDINTLSNESTNLGGLYPAISGNLPVGWDSGWWSSRGYVQNDKGEFVKGGVVSPPTTGLNFSIPSVKSPVVSIDVVGYIKLDAGNYPIVLVKFDDGKYRSYRSDGAGSLIGNGKNLFDMPNVIITNGSSASAIKNMVIDDVTNYGGFEASRNGYKFK